MTVYMVPGVFGVGGQILDSNGKPVSGGLVGTYAAGTTSPVVVFTTAAGNVSAANPVVTSSDGRLPHELWQTGGQAIKITLTDSLLNTLGGPYDNLTGINDPTTLLTTTNTWTGTQNFRLINVTTLTVSSLSVSGQISNLSVSSLNVSNNLVGFSSFLGRVLVGSSIGNLIPDDTLSTFTGWNVDHINVPSSIHSTSTNPDRLTVPSGYSLARLTAGMYFTANRVGQRKIAISKNGTQTVCGPPDVRVQAVSTASNDPTIISLSSPFLTVVPGDYFVINVVQSSGAPMVVGPTIATFFAMELFQ